VLHTADGNVSIGTAELQSSYDIVNKTYTVRATDGTEDRLQFSGASIRRVLDLAGVDPGSVKFLQTPRSDGTEATLSGDDLGPNPPFPDGPPLIFVDGDSVRYLRPVRNARDSNASDNLATQSGAPLEISTRTGNILDVHITADGAGAGKLAFEATASGGLPGESIDFTWDFGDGTTGAGATITHQYASKGTYRIVARAEGDQDSAGSSNILRFAVSPPTDDGNGPGNGSNHGGNALPDGPKFGNGHQSSGQPHGGKKPTGDLESTESPEQPTGTSGTPGAPAPTYGGDSTYPPATSTDPLLPQASGALPELKPGHTPPPAPNPTEPQGETVVGRLLSSEIPVTPGVPAVAPSTGAASAAGDSSTSVWTGTGLGVGTLLLIGAGAALELRGIRGSFRMHA
jgi:hypothetical protein